MGAGASVDNEGATAYAEEVVTGMGLDGTSEEDTAKIKEDCVLVHNTISAGINAELSANYKGGFPGGGGKAKGENAMVNKWKWSVSKYLKGAALFAKHMDKVHGLFQQMGPVNVPKGGIQVTRKSLTAKMVAAGIPANVAAANCNKAMQTIGKEKAQAVLSEAHYLKALETLMESEGASWADNCESRLARAREPAHARVPAAPCCRPLHRRASQHTSPVSWLPASTGDGDKWAIKDKSLCPITVAVKADLDKLDTNGEFGINQHEMRMYFFELFMTYGEASLRELAGWTKLVGGEVSADEFEVM